MRMVNQLPLPLLLVELIASNRWAVPGRTYLKSWTQFFNHGGLAIEGDLQIRLFSIDEMGEKTTKLSCELFPVKVDSDWKNSITKHLKAESVDPEKSVVIADLLYRTRFPDTLVVPIVLDYRYSIGSPRVICYPDDAFEKYWYEVSPRFEDFVRALGL